MSPLHGDSRSEPAGTAVVLKALAVGICLAYSVYLFTVQVIKGETYSAQAQKYAMQSIKIPAPRGEIYDRNNDRPLVANEEAFAVEVIPANIPEEAREGVFARLVGVLDLKPSDMDRKIPPRLYRSYLPVQITSSASFSAITEIAENVEEFPGVSWSTKPIRKYLDVGSLAHALGYVGEIGRDEYKILYNEGYAADDVVGKAGIEKVYDSVLKGKDGRLSKSVDVKGRDLAEEEKVERPIPGNRLVLTIDRRIQSIAEAALGPRTGSVVVLKPSTGEILAMVSYPWYDPNLFTTSVSGDEYAKLLTDVNKPLLNRAIQSSYPPASTFKTVLTAAILEEKVLPPEQKILCRGVMDYGGRAWNCWIHSPGHGPIDLKGGLAQSCDIYYWVAGRDYLGVDRIASYSSYFGYGKPTGIDLPSENSGVIPNPSWKEKTLNERWTPGDTMNLSIGQGYMLATPLQVANMMALVSNGGTIYRPHLLKEVRDTETGALLQATSPEILLESPISRTTLDQLGADLRGVITYGTARTPVSTKIVQVAGKTGTAEVGLKDRWHSWFASYGPYDAPPEDRIVVVTMIEATNPWEWWAPYAANVIYQAVFSGQTVQEAAAAVGVSLSGTTVRGRQE